MMPPVPEILQLNCILPELEQLSVKLPFNVIVLAPELCEKVGVPDPIFLKVPPPLATVNVRFNDAVDVEKSIPPEVKLPPRVIVLLASPKLFVKLVISTVPC